jgi:hypothetical protein
MLFLDRYVKQQMNSAFLVFVFDLADRDARPASVEPPASSESFGIQPVKVCWGYSPPKLMKVFPLPLIVTPVTTNFRDRAAKDTIGLHPLPQLEGESVGEFCLPPASGKPSARQAVFGLG